MATELWEVPECYHEFETQNVIEKGVATEVWEVPENFEFEKGVATEVREVPEENLELPRRGRPRRSGRSPRGSLRSRSSTSHGSLGNVQFLLYLQPR